MKKALQLGDILTFPWLMCHFYFFPGVPKQCWLVFEAFRKQKQAIICRWDRQRFPSGCEGGLEWRQQEFIVLEENKTKAKLIEIWV